MHRNPHKPEKDEMEEENRTPQTTKKANTKAKEKDKTRSFWDKLEDSGAGSSEDFELL